jgi:hypothetical protein
LRGLLEGIGDFDERPFAQRLADERGPTDLSRPSFSTRDLGSRRVSRSALV